MGLQRIKKGIGPLRGKGALLGLGGSDWFGGQISSRRTEPVRWDIYMLW